MLFDFYVLSFGLNKNYYFYFWDLISNFYFYFFILSFFLFPGVKMMYLYFIATYATRNLCYCKLYEMHIIIYNHKNH